MKPDKSEPSVRTHFASTLANDRVPWADTCCCDAHEHLAFTRGWERHVIDYDDFWWPEAMNTNGFHELQNLSAKRVTSLRPVIE